MILKNYVTPDYLSKTRINPPNTIHLLNVDNTHILFHRREKAHALLLSFCMEMKTF